MPIKIAIITYHYGYNEGTMLQAHAVQKLMDRQFGNGSSEIIDHRYPTKEKIVFTKPANKREIALRAFYDDQLRLSAFKNTSSDLAPTWKHVSGNYDLVILGSDELWRLDYTRQRKFFLPVRRQINPWAPAFPNVYWPDAEALGVPCVSLAASISEKDLVRDIPTKHRRALINVLKHISLLTVRDSRTEAFVRSLVGPDLIKPQWLPDPTFFLDAPSTSTINSTRDILTQSGVDFSQRLALIISHTGSPVLTRAIKHLKQNNFKILCANTVHNGTDYDLSAAPLGPIEWSALSSFVDVVVTDRFHGAVFALKNNVPVIALDFRDQLSGNDSKMLDLLKRFGVEKNWISVRSGSTGHMEARLTEAIGGSWPEKHVARISNEFRQILIDFATGPLAALAQNSFKDRKNTSKSFSK